MPLISPAVVAVGHDWSKPGHLSWAKDNKAI